MAVLLICGWNLGHFLITAIWKATHLCISALLFSVCLWMEENWDKRDPEVGREILLALGCRWESGPSPPCHVYPPIFSFCFIFFLLSFFFFPHYSKQQILYPILYYPLTSFWLHNTTKVKLLGTRYLNIFTTFLHFYIKIVWSDALKTDFIEKNLRCFAST